MKRSNKQIINSKTNIPVYIDYNEYDNVPHPIYIPKIKNKSKKNLKN